MQRTAPQTYTLYNSLKHLSNLVKHNRAVFTWVSKVICVCFGFALLRSVIGLKILRHFLSQSELKPKTIVTRSRTFSRASSQLHVFASSYDWFTGLSVSFVIGQCNYFGFGWLHAKDSSTDFNWELQLKVKTTLKSIIKSTMWKYCSIAFIWLATY